MPRARFHFVLIVLAVTLIPSVSQAALLLPGANQPLGGGLGVPAGPIAATLTSSFVTADLSGTIKTDVYAQDAGNPLGGLTFVYTVHNNVTSVDSIGRATV